MAQRLFLALGFHLGNKFFPTKLGELGNQPLLFHYK